MLIMPIDWTQPQPSYEDLHAKIDALATERNAAVAEARLWQRRLLTAQTARDQAIADLRAADKSHEAWEAAYADLLRDFRRLEVKLRHAQWSLDCGKLLDELTQRGEVVG